MYDNRNIHINDNITYSNTDVNNTTTSIHHSNNILDDGSNVDKTIYNINDTTKYRYHTVPSNNSTWSDIYEKVIDEYYSNENILKISDIVKQYNMTVSDNIYIYESILLRNKSMLESNSVSDNDTTTATTKLCDNSEIWHELGMCHISNDMDDIAIECFQNALIYDSYHLPSLLQLSICYLNEVDYANTYMSLNEYMTHHPKYYNIGSKYIVNKNVDSGMSSSGTYLTQVLDMVAMAEKIDPGNMDIQIMYGVLHNITKDYQKAISCFEKCIICSISSDNDTCALYNKVSNHKL
jgi:peroxin-5